jgi:hypothetical protein
MAVNASPLHLAAPQKIRDKIFPNVCGAENILWMKRTGSRVLLRFYW